MREIAKKVCALITLISTIVTSLSLTACQMVDSNGVTYVKTDSEEKRIPISNVEQVAIKNENFLDTEISWYNGDYNYWVYDIGKIKNVPLTPTYAVFVYDGAEFKYSNEIVKTTIKGMETSTSTAITKSVKLTVGGSATQTKGISANLGKSIGANIEKGVSISATGEASKQTMWTDTYTSTQSYSESYKTNVTLTFNNSCQTGNYLFLYLGNITVYLAIVQSRSTGEYFYETYNKIDSYKYVLKYTGEDDEFPINEERKIEIDTSFVDSLSTPTVYIDGLSKGDTIKQSVSRQESQTVDPLTVAFLWFKIEDFDKYYSQGYNKIKIKYKYYTKGGWSLFGGNVNIQMYISPDNKSENNIYNSDTASSKDGKWIEGIIQTDLQWFKSNQEIHFIFENNNLTEEYTISNFLVEIEIYYEE